MIPMVDLQRQYQSLRPEIDAALQEVLAGARYILGPNVQALEDELARYLGVDHAITCASGTDALHLALAAAALPGRRGHHDAVHLHCHRRGHSLCRGRPGVRGH